jgi:hypothetical protein
MNESQLIDTAKLYCRLPGNEAGGNLHLALSDGNCDDESMWTCIRRCAQESDRMGLYIVSFMLFAMTEEQRDRFYCKLHRLDYRSWLKSMNDAAERVIAWAKQ